MVDLTPAQWSILVVEHVSVAGHIYGAVQRAYGEIVATAQNLWAGGKISTSSPGAAVLKLAARGKSSYG